MNENNTSDTKIYLDFFKTENILIIQIQLNITLL